MPKAILYHNPRCSKSREALAYVQQQIDDLVVIEYLKQPPTRQDLDAIFKALDVQNAHQMIRSKEAEYQLAGLNQDASNDEVLDAVAKYPKLLERPIMMYGSRAAIGRPLDHIVALLHA
ncbi:arsenate reductase (glutaredoxin) [Glaciecola siphonariae]|uniref:Arsenate reductase n=1 Tax=Glaciecola siphonariae TaxID=521012 RepID=A0ABV9LUI9_9ALTE